MPATSSTSRPYCAATGPTFCMACPMSRISARLTLAAAAIALLTRAASVASRLNCARPDETNPAASASPRLPTVAASSTGLSAAIASSRDIPDLSKSSIAAAASLLENLVSCPICIANWRTVSICSGATPPNNSICFSSTSKSAAVSKPTLPTATIGAVMPNNPKPAPAIC